VITRKKVVPPAPQTAVELCAHLKGELGDLGLFCRRAALYQNLRAAARRGDGADARRGAASLAVVRAGTGEVRRLRLLHHSLREAGAVPNSRSDCAGSRSHPTSQFLVIEKSVARRTRALKLECRTVLGVDSDRSAGVCSSL